MASRAERRLSNRGWTATRNNGNVSARDQYREMRRYGATPREAYDIAKAYKSMTTGDYYR